VGRPLFVRRTRALELTPAGEQLQNVVRRMLGELDRRVSELRGIAAIPRVTVATYASFASLWLVPRLPEFQRQHPGVDIRIDAADRNVDLEAEDVDLAIRWVRPGARPTGGELLLEERANAALSPRLQAMLPQPIARADDLVHVPLLEPDESMGTAADANWALWCRHAGIAPFTSTGRLYFTYIDQLVQAAVRGQGAAIVRSPFLEDLVASGDLVVPFPGLAMETGYRYFLLTNARRAGAGPVMAFKAWVMAAFRRGPVRIT
jgi:LysR family glycine cleavage system transcriptional activator